MNSQIALFSPPKLTLSGTLTPSVRDELLKKLGEFERAKETHAYLLIDSDGGDADSAVLLYRALQKSTVFIHGFVSSIADSSASLVLQGCRRRSMTQQSTMQVHFFSKKITAQIAYNPEMRERCVLSFREEQDAIIALYMERSGLDRELIIQILTKGDTGHVFSAKEALQYRLIDDILPHL